MTVAPGELLAVLRVGGWRCGVPLGLVVRVLSAAMPVKVPRGEGTSFVLRLGEALAPVVFGAALFGASAVELGVSDKMVVLRLPGGDCVLWVDAVEDLAPYVPLNAPAPADAGPWVACFSGGEPTLAVLDLEKVAAEYLPGGG